MKYKVCDFLGSHETYTNHRHCDAVCRAVDVGCISVSLTKVFDERILSLKKNKIMISRRPFLKTITGAALGVSASSVFARSTQQDFKIGACDWSIRKKQDIEAFDVAQTIGLEGLQVSFSSPGLAYDLRDQKVREQYYRRSDETGIEIASLGMGVLNQKPLATHPEAIDWVSDVIDVLSKMQRDRPGKAPNVCLLAFFGKGDINGKPNLMQSVIRKLRSVAKKAEDHGVILGIESYLSADDHLKIIDGVGSKNIQVYYDSANSARMGYDIYEEVKQIGGERICEVHCKEDKALIGTGPIDFKRWNASLVQAGFKGWLIIEGALPKGGDLIESYQKNYRALDKVFRGKG